VWVACSSNNENHLVKIEKPASSIVSLLSYALIFGNNFRACLCMAVEVERCILLLRKHIFKRRRLDFEILDSKENSCLLYLFYDEILCIKRENRTEAEIHFYFH